jgi:hypothetical protein
MTDLKGPEPDPLFEDRLVVLYAEGGEDAAMKKAKKIGKSEAHSFKNIDGETVSWVFREVLDLIQLDTHSIEDGTEVYHHFLTAAEVDQVRQSLKAGSL